jgi:nucleotide-binding universal stress UspA family protein
LRVREWFCEPVAVALQVLVGTDGSEDALAAARRALELLTSDATVHLVAVAEVAATVDPVAPEVTAGYSRPHEFDPARARAIDDATAALERAASALGGVAVETYVDGGDPGPVLCERARALNADVMVVGSRGRGAIRRVLLGSVSTYLVQNAPCPVLVVRAAPSPSSNPRRLPCRSPALPGSHPGAAGMRER